MVDKVKFDENFFDKTNNKEKHTLSKINPSNKNHPLYDNNFHDFIVILNEESYPYCNEELNTFNTCKLKYKNNPQYLLFNNLRANEMYIEELKKECYNEIIFVYNCLKRFGKYM